MIELDVLDFLEINFFWKRDNFIDLINIINYMQCKICAVLKIK